MEEVKLAALRELEEDEVGLWLLCRWVREKLRTEDPVAVSRLTLQVVRELLETGGVVAGYYGSLGSGVPPGYITPWPGSVEDILDRIDREWAALGREPNIGEIVIFHTKDSWLVRPS